MTKDDREILTGVRVGGRIDGGRRVRGRVITDPDELEKVEGVDLQALYDSGAIAGTWKGVKAHAAEETPKAKKGAK